MTPMLYVQEMGWRGCLIAIAFSEEEARILMTGHANYLPERPLVSYDITTVGLKHVCWGDW